MPTNSHNPHCYYHTIRTDFVLKDCVFGSVKITKDKGPDNYVYNGFEIGFGSTSTFSHSDGTNAAHNIIIFSADSSQSVHSSNKLAEKELVLGKGLIQKINKQAVYADHKFPTNFTKTDKKFCLSLYYDGSNCRFFLNAKRQVVFKAKDSEITPYKMCLGNISVDFNATNAQKTGLHEIFMILLLNTECFQTLNYMTFTGT